ncbi:MAG TPA: tetratricopeptide repeat protein [Actinomycetes bacterium]|nr:tetratricopeptide repeat protein [Actinomycetes bacterium]
MTAWVERAQLLLRQSRPEEAERELRQELAVRPDDPTAHGLLALTLAMRKRHEEATAAAAQAVRLAPDWSFPHYALAHVLLDRGRLDQAEQAIQEAIRLSPTNARMFATLGWIRAHQERWPAALEAAERGLALDPEEVDCANVRAMALVRLGRRDDARATLDSALAHQPDNALTHANQGWALMHAGDHRAALDRFKEALRLDPQLDWARAGLVKALKARNPLYGALLRYFLWMSRLPARTRWAVLIGALLVARVLGPLAPLYLLFLWLTWTAEPMSNLLLRLSRYGRLALSREETVASNWLGGCLAVALALAALALPLRSVRVLAGAGAFALLTIPLAAVFECDRGWPRTTMAAYTGALALLALLGVAASPLTGSGTAWPAVLIGVAALGALLGTWVGTWLITRRVRA